MEHEQTDAGPQPAPDTQTGPGVRHRRAAAPAPSVEAPATPWSVPKGMSLAEHFTRFQIITDKHAAALRAPLPADSVQKATAKETGKKYDATGHGYQWVADRLSEVFGPGGWTEDHENLETAGTWGQRNLPCYHITCRITLQVGRWVMPAADGAGVVPVPVFQPVGRWISYGEHIAGNRGDCRKGAQTNALKKVAALALGVGADAFRGTIDDDMAGPKPQDDPRQRQSRPTATPDDRAATRRAQATVDFRQASRPGACCLCDEQITPGEWVAYPVAHPYTGRMRAAHKGCYDREFPAPATSAPRTRQNGQGDADGQLRQPAASQRPASGADGYLDEAAPPERQAPEPDPDDDLPF